MIDVLIVDDERLARVELNRLLAKLDNINVVGQANSASEALSFLSSHHVDAIFLDIQMPQMSGLELVEHIEPSIQCIFCTAFNEHAVDAFSLNAIDYLVKPVSFERLKQATKKLKATSGNQPTNYLPDSHGLLLKVGQSSHIVRLNAIERFESIGNHVAVYTDIGKSYIHSSLSKVEARLDPAMFFKASRSDIIRIDKIIKLEEGIATGSLVAHLHNGQTVEVSRRQAKSLKDLYNVF